MGKDLEPAAYVVGEDEGGTHQPRKLQIGVSFKDLRCFGSTSTTQYQESFLHVIPATLRFVAGIFKPRPKHHVEILRGFEGMILPGEMLLVLGRPGSGCSTLLKALGGEIQGLHLNDEDSVNYQGISYREFHSLFKGERVYLAEQDVHFPELTLGQTLNFAASTRTKKVDPNFALDVASRFKLTEAFHTPVGDALIRGISGGEKRRTSLAEAFVGGAQVQFWDNSTRGLDSLTAGNFVQLLRDTTNRHKSTVAMSLYQTSEDMYENFDSVVVLYEGRQIYFGPVELAADYFTKLGFVKPSRATTADFLTSLTNPAERIIQAGYETIVPQLPDEFSNVWKHSEEAAALRAKIDSFNALHPIRMARSVEDVEKATRHELLSLQTSTYPLTIVRQTLACLSRAIQRSKANATADISAIIANTILGVIIGSLFFKLPEDAENLQQRSVLLFFALMVNAFVPGSEVVVMWAQRPIVEKHDRYAFYHPFTERLASLISDLAAKVAISFSIHLPIYFMTNLRQSAAAFFVYWLFMFVNLNTMSVLFRMIGSVSRTREQTTVPVSVIVLLCIIYTGFIVPPDYMVPWLGWFWRINPLAYTYESLLINEMRDRSFPCSTMIPAGPSYTNISTSDKICTTVGSSIGELQIQGTTYLSDKYDFLPNHLWRNFGILIAMMVAFGIAHLLAAEYIPAQPSRGEVLLFRNKEAAQEMEARTRQSRTILATADGRDTQPAKKEDIAVAPPSRQPSILHWSRLNYEIKTGGNNRKILQDIHGWIKPGTLTALMGVTGAGKTSLLNVLADRATTGVVSGDVYVGSRHRNAGFRRKVGYVQQEDIHLATTTVREALQFCALLKQPDHISKEDKLASVESTLDMMDMKWYADAIVGVPGEGLNVEQRKRLTIAVELVAKPELLLFLDEPTSGLDSQTAWSICTLLRKLVDNGQTILCTIHQPSSQLFRMFDRLLLLDKGGTTLYFGDIGNDASTLIKYFEDNGASKCQPKENPAEWMLKVTGNAPSTSTDTDPQENTKPHNWTDMWNASPQKQDVVNYLAHIRSEAVETDVSLPNKDGEREYAVPLARQLAAVTKRILQDQWRDPVYLHSKFALSILLALFNGISFYNNRLDIQGVINLIFSIFLVTQLFSCVDQLVIPYFINSRAIFEARERDSRAYSWAVFMASNILVELVWQTIIAVPVFAAWYYPTGLQRYGDASMSTSQRGAVTFLLIWLFTLWSSTISQFFAASIQHTEVAMQIATLFYWLSLVFCGVLTPPDRLAQFWIFMYRVSPLTYLIEGLATAGLAGTDVTCSPVEVLHIPFPQDSGALSCGQYLNPFITSGGGHVLNPADNADCQYCPLADANSILASFGMDQRHAWRNVGLMAVYVVFNVFATIGIYWLARVPKRKN
ncbi:ABC-2 type transporter-domain-containing protein [Rostrohypoxylon terebratum]|nr:ABC-2 type transporter-domain-containing protein [Rostrohypoxylon terebratum]